MVEKKVSSKKYPRLIGDVPVTQKMLYCVRDELVSKFESLEYQQKSLEHRFDSFSQDVKSEVHRIALLVEEQNARNAIVMDGLTNLFERQDRIEHAIESR